MVVVKQPPGPGEPAAAGANSPRCKSVKPSQNAHRAARGASPRRSALTAAQQAWDYAQLGGSSACRIVSGLLNVTVSMAGGLRRYRGMGMPPGMRGGGAGWLRSEPGRMRLPPTGSCGPRQTLNPPMSTPTAHGPPRTVRAHNTQMRSTGQQASDREHAHGAAAARQNIRSVRWPCGVSRHTVPYGNGGSRRHYTLRTRAGTSHLCTPWAASAAGAGDGADRRRTGSDYGVLHRWRNPRDR